MAVVVAVGSGGVVVLEDGVGPLDFRFAPMFAVALLAFINFNIERSVVLLAFLNVRGLLFSTSLLSICLLFISFTILKSYARA